MSQNAKHGESSEGESAEETPSPAERLFGVPTESTVELDGQTVLAVSGAGLVVEVLETAGHAERGDTEALNGAALDDLWPGAPTDRLRLKVRRALRSRQVQTAEFADERDASHHDFVIVPQGRDRALVVVRDVSERRSAYSRLEHLAYVDATTKLPNQLFLLEEIGRCLEAVRLQEGRAAVLCFNVSGAERRAGAHRSQSHDEVFVELASRLTHELRGANEESSDDYERYSVVARIDEQQFGVLLPVIASGADAESVVVRLLDTLKQPIKLPKRSVTLDVHAGIALYPQDGTDAEALFTNALAAMEDARSSGHAHKFHSGTVRLRALQRQDLELELKAALDRDEFTIEYLPCVDAQTREPTAFEALLRWPQNVFGAKSIRRVISVAENTGLILPIGDWVLRRSCEALKAWHERGWPALRVSVNFSAQQFASAKLAERIGTVLTETGIDAGFLDVEITEYALFRDAMKGFPTLQELRALGVGLVVDDYGTGACSLAHLARSPIDAIKIDNAFVADLELSGRDAAACGAIAAMAVKLGLRVVAEGVESEVQAERLSELGCEELQGFLFARPLAEAQADKFLEKHARSPEC